MPSSDAVILLGGLHPIELVSRLRTRGVVTIWPVQHDKARFNELLDACQREGPQVLSRRGTKTALLVPIDPWRRLQAAGPSLSCRSWPSRSTPTWCLNCADRAPMAPCSPAPTPSL